MFQSVSTQKAELELLNKKQHKINKMVNSKTIVNNVISEQITIINNLINLITDYSTSQLQSLVSNLKVVKFSTRGYCLYALRMDLNKKTAFTVTGDDDR